MATVKPLGTLISNSVNFLKSHLTAVVVGAVVFAVASQAIGTYFVGSTVTTLRGTQWGQQMESLGKRMQELQETAMSQGGMDEASQKEMEDLAKQMMEGSAQGMQHMRGMFMTMLPSIGVGLLIAIAVALIAKSYYLVIAVKGTTDPLSAMQVTAQWILPLLGLWVWLFLRSFLWIPGLGIILAIILGPRFVLAPLYLLEQGKGVTESARVSFANTRGYWGKIFGNVFVVALVTIIAAKIFGGIASVILGGMIGGFVGAAALSFASAFIVIFSIHLARTVMETSRAA